MNNRDSSVCVCVHAYEDTRANTHTHTHTHTNTHNIIHVVVTVIMNWQGQNQAVHNNNQWGYMYAIRMVHL